MADRYVEDDGQPRYGQRVSPEELEAIRREQGLGSAAQPGERQAPGAEQWGTQGEHDPYVYAGQRPGAADGGLAGPGAVRPPEGGWSWQQENARQPRKRRWGTLVVGLVMLIVLPIALGVGAVLTAVSGSLSTGAVLTASGEVYLDEGQTVGLYSADTSVSADQCSFVAPSGSAVAIGTIGRDLPYVSVTATESGTYTVSCPRGTEGLVVGPALNEDRLVPAGLMMLGAVVIAVAGLVVTIIGLVRVSRRR